MWRRRISYFALALATIVVGLVIHLGGEPLGATARDILGDAVWASMIVWLISAIVPGARLVARCAVAYAICVLVEVSQLYRTPTLDALRQTQIGHLVLGSGFDPRDLVSYALGVAGAMVVSSLIRGDRYS